MVRGAHLPRIERVVFRWYNLQRSAWRCASVRPFVRPFVREQQIDLKGSFFLDVTNYKNVEPGECEILTTGHDSDLCTNKKVLYNHKKTKRIREKYLLPSLANVPGPGSRAG